MANLKSILRSDFNPNEVSEQPQYDNSPLPAGVYSVEVTNAEVKDLKSGNGVGLTLEFTVIDPVQYAKRKVWQNLNIQHTNATAQEIGERDLALMCRAIGIAIPEDTDELFGRVLRIRTKIRPAQGQYEARAEVAGYEQAGTTPLTQAKPATAPAATKAAPPWAKKAA